MNDERAGIVDDRREACAVEILEVNTMTASDRTEKAVVRFKRDF